MPFANANGLEICYETFGDPAQPALLLVHGLGAQLIAWDDEFCRALVERGFHVVRFDNRDAGLSTKVEGVEPNIGAVMAGDRSSVPYLLEDMADDAAALLDALAIERAHVVGASMGGMIVQELAIRHPDRVLSLASIMSTTGDGTSGMPAPEAIGALVAPQPASRTEAIESGVRMQALVGNSPAFPADEAVLRAEVTAAYDRAYNPAGFLRQFAAIIASPDRTERLRALTVPAVVIHGEADILVTPSGGAATAAAIPGATLVTIPGMGHDLPPGAWPVVLDAIVENARRAGA